MPQALDLVDVYEASDHGPLFLKPSAPGTFSRLRSDQSASDPHVIDRAMLFLQQTLIDYVYSPGALAPCSRSTFEGRGWQTSRHYPGRADPPADGSVVHSVLVDGSLPRFWGVQVAFATEDARRPTGFYLSPGQVATVTVPESMIQTENAKQFKILVGGQTSDNTIKDMHRRMDRTTVTYRIRAVTTLVTNPLGGALYILVPYLADAGVVEIRITGGVVPSPHFRRVSFHAMTNADWQVARGAAGPWADFETDHFMLNVPTSWVYNLPDAVDLMRHYNLAMDGASEWLGYPPHLRHRPVLFIAADLHIAQTAFGVGYPQVNVEYNTVANYGGYANEWMVRDPTASYVTWHELGHACLNSKYYGEEEAINNFMYTYILHVREWDPNPL